MRRWMHRPEGSNWGDFGDDDQIGRLNLLTPARRLAAMREVRDGVVFTLSLPLDYPGGTALSPHRKPPQLIAAEVHEGEAVISGYCRCLSRYAAQFTDVVNDDAVLLYTQYSTQWDALSHVGQEFDADGDGIAEIVFYNGYRAEAFTQPAGAAGPYAKALGIENMAATGLQGRGVLVDLYRSYGTRHERVGYDALMREIEAQKVELHAGDILCLYTGYADLLLAQDRQPDGALLRRSFVGLDGADARLLRWIDTSQIAAICADNPAVEYVSPRPRGTARHAMLPLHEHCLFKLGLHLGELWYFKGLAAHLAAQGRSAFLLTAPPLRLPGSVGSPVTPVATV